VTLSDEVECDEAYVIAGHKGQPEVVKSKERQGRRRRLQGKAGRGTLAKERPPVFGMMQRGGQVVLNLLANVQQKTIEPVIKDTIVPETRVYTDEYSIYARLQTWGYAHKPTVSLGVTYALAYTYGSDDGRIWSVRCAVIVAGLDDR
jgi:transposase-like protein